MITDLLFNAVVGIILLILSPLGKITWIFDISAIQPVLEVLRMIAYIIPFGRLMPIISFFFLLMGFRIAISLIKTIWNLLPIV